MTDEAISSPRRHRKRAAPAAAAHDPVAALAATLRKPTAADRAELLRELAQEQEAAQGKDLETRYLLKHGRRPSEKEAKELAMQLKRPVLDSKGVAQSPVMTTRFREHYLSCARHHLIEALEKLTQKPPTVAEVVASLEQLEHRAELYLPPEKRTKALTTLRLIGLIDDSLQRLTELRAGLLARYGEPT